MGLDLVFDALHLFIQKCRQISALGQISHDLRLRRTFFLVIDLVLQAGPKIHGNGPDLDLDDHLLDSVCQKDRHLYQKMQTAIAIRLGIFDIILDADDLEVSLPTEVFVDHINILHKGTDDTDTADIVQIFLCALRRDLKALADQLFHGFFRGLDARLQMFDGVVRMQIIIFLI